MDWRPKWDTWHVYAVKEDDWSCQILIGFFNKTWCMLEYCRTRMRCEWAVPFTFWGLIQYRCICVSFKGKTARYKAFQSQFPWPFFCVCVFWHMQLYVLIHQTIFRFYSLNILYFFKYSCTNIFHRRSLHTFYRRWTRIVCAMTAVHDSLWLQRPHRFMSNVPHFVFWTLLRHAYKNERKIRLTLDINQSLKIGERWYPVKPCKLC